MGTADTTDQCRPLITSVVVKDLRLEDEDRTRTWCQGQGQGLENWSSRILSDKDFPRGQQHCCEAVRWDRHELGTWLGHSGK